MIKMEGSVVIERPIEQVWGFLTSAENASKWDTGILEARQTSSGPVGLGTTLEAVREMRGRRRSMNVKVTEFEPIKRVAWAIDFGMGTGTSIYSFETAVCGTLLSKSSQVELKGVYNLLTPIMRRRLTAEEVGLNLNNIKQNVEASA
jgi:uncharacterized protein YndB with AHSA1/START domain